MNEQLSIVLDNMRRMVESQKRMNESLRAFTAALKALQKVGKTGSPDEEDTAAPV
jgi:hypothetical protein